MKKPAKKKRLHPPTDLRPDIVAALEKAFPFDKVERVYSSEDEESYLIELYPKVRHNLGRIRGGHIVYERPPEGNREWAEDPDTGHEDMVIDDIAYSYHLLFLSPSGEEFRIEFEDEGGSMENPEMVKFEGDIGCAVGVSEIAPFAVIRFSSIAHADDGSEYLPSIETGISSEDGDPLDPDQFYRGKLGEKAFKKLAGLRNSIAQVLEKLGIAILPEEECQKIVPWLKPGEEAFLLDEVSVQNAFFFTGP
jgi:hypothetical protein